MTLQLELPASLEERLRQEAERFGKPSESVALQLLEEHLPPRLSERQTAAIAMLHRWMEEDEALSPEEEAANEAVLRALDEDRKGERQLFPPELKGLTW
jgi:predicted transcriptional regulator